MAGIRTYGDRLEDIPTKVVDAVIEVRHGDVAEQGAKRGGPFDQCFVNISLLCRDDLRPKHALAGLVAGQREQIGPANSDRSLRQASIFRSTMQESMRRRQLHSSLKFLSRIDPLTLPSIRKASPACRNIREPRDGDLV